MTKIRSFEELAPALALKTALANSNEEGGGICTYPECGCVVVLAPEIVCVKKLPMQEYDGKALK